MLNIGVIGYGYWGPNIVRNLTDINGTSIKAVCDTSPEVLKKVQQKYPHTLSCTQKGFYK